MALVARCVEMMGARAMLVASTPSVVVPVATWAPGLNGGGLPSGHSRRRRSPTATGRLKGQMSRRWLFLLWPGPWRS